MPYIVIKAYTLKKNNLTTDLKSILVAITVLFSGVLFSQNQSITPNEQNEFWEKVQFGGGIGLNFGSGYTEISVAPSAIYNFNQYVAFGLGAQYSYQKQKNYYASHLYGGSIIGLFNPIKEIQLSAELEQLRVNVDLDGSNSNSQDYWNTGLFLGAGYRTGNVTLGVRYNVLFNENDNVYGDAFMPFVRVYF
jgi:hypothetical protein